MANIINASVSPITGIITTADGSGILQLQSNGTSALSVTANGKILVSNTTLGTATAGTMEYDGKVPYFTPLGTQRGIIPGMQYYALSSGYTGTNSSGSQSVFGVGVTLSDSTQYIHTLL